MGDGEIGLTVGIITGGFIEFEADKLTRSLVQTPAAAAGAAVAGAVGIGVGIVLFGSITRFTGPTPS